MSVIDSLLSRSVFFFNGILCIYLSLPGKTYSIFLAIVAEERSFALRSWFGFMPFCPFNGKKSCKLFFVKSWRIRGLFYLLIDGWPILEDPSEIIYFYHHFFEFFVFAIFGSF